VMASLRFAFNAGHFIRIGYEHKNGRWLAMGAQCVEKNSWHVQSPCRDLGVECCGEVRFIPAPLGLCLHSFEHRSVAFWEQQAVGRISILFRPSCE